MSRRRRPRAPEFASDRFNRRLGDLMERDEDWHRFKALAQQLGQPAVLGGPLVEAPDEAMPEEMQRYHRLHTALSKKYSPLPPIAVFDYVVQHVKEGTPPHVDFSVYVANITDRDLNDLATRFKKYIRAARSRLPKELRRTPSQKHEPAEFIRTLSEEQYQKHLLRYDLHIKHGLTFRLIALLEQMERRGKAMLDSPKPARVGNPVKGEDAVQKSVKRLYQLIQGTHYRARRRRLDTPGTGVVPFNCPDHPNPPGCPDARCPHPQEWWSRVKGTLPKDATGIGVEHRRSKRTLDTGGD